MRDTVIGSARRAPDADELAAMRREVREGFEAGARSLSFGLVYVPGRFAATDELVALAEEAARVRRAARAAHPQRGATASSGPSAR